MLTAVREVEQIRKGDVLSTVRQQPARTDGEDVGTNVSSQVFALAQDPLVA